MIRWTTLAPDLKIKRTRCDSLGDLLPNFLLVQEMRVLQHQSPSRPHRSVRPQPGYASFAARRRPPPTRSRRHPTNATPERTTGLYQRMEGAAEWSPWEGWTVLEGRRRRSSSRGDVFGPRRDGSHGASCWKLKLFERAVVAPRRTRRGWWSSRRSLDAAVLLVAVAAAPPRHGTVLPRIIFFPPPWPASHLLGEPPSQPPPWPATEPATEPAAEPAALQSATGPAATEPATKPATKPATEPAAEPTAPWPASRPARQPPSRSASHRSASQPLSQPIAQPAT
jgi:hypothetical protein